MTILRTLLILASVLAFGCDSEPERKAERDVIAPTAEDVRSDAGSPKGDADGGARNGFAVGYVDDAGRYRLAADGICRTLEDQAFALRESYQTCTRDDDCVLHHLASSCIEPLLCHRTFNRAADLAVLTGEAAALSAEYQRQQCPCAVARCITPPNVWAICDPERKVCKTMYGRFGPDGGSAMFDGGLDGGTAPSDAAFASPEASTAADASALLDAGPIPSPYRCDTASDCVIKNVGNCCGYYPRCANVDATFAPPDCSDGQGSVCGWPEITDCACRENLCRSMQGDREI